MPMIGLDFGFIYQPILSRAMQKIKHHTVCDCEDMLGSLNDDNDNRNMTMMMTMNRKFFHMPDVAQSFH